ncbi:MAG: tRNA (guanosine(37)-N1)-methyltransferase TrmD [Acidiferrobacteraceae bacterium]|nr:tRNA (guanosine(37)-N1)-methyltransferase TrmD [Acidiferrobacteraceae bacterium]
MRIDVISIFPEMFKALTCCGMALRAIERGALDLRLWDPRDTTKDKHRRIDDRPYGGGPGMVMLAQPLMDTLSRLRQDDGASKVIYLTPQGTRLKQDKIRDLAGQSRLILLSGRYEGIDERVIDREVDEEISIGDYILTGGELPAMVLIEGLIRYLPGVLGNEESVFADSFTEGLLDWPHYTRPVDFAGHEVPNVLLGGNHEEIRRWRLKQALGRTWERRPDLIEQLVLTDEQKELLLVYQKEHTSEEVLR